MYLLTTFCEDITQIGYTCNLKIKNKLEPDGTEKRSVSLI